MTRSCQRKSGSCKDVVIRTGLMAAFALLLLLASSAARADTHVTPSDGSSSSSGFWGNVSVGSNGSVTTGTNVWGGASTNGSDVTSSTGFTVGSSGSVSDVASAVLTGSNSTDAPNQDGTDPCPDTNLARQLYQANESGYASVGGQVLNTMDSMNKYYQEHPITNAKGDRYFCLGYKFKEFFQKLLDFISDWKSAIKKLLIQLVESILEKVCSFVASTINSLLSMVCIPLPNISLPNFSLPGFGGQSCDGISLSSFVQITSGQPLDLKSKLDDVPFFKERVSRGTPEWISGTIF